LTLTCGACGTDLPSGSRFCTHCGTPVHPSAAARPRFGSPEAYTPKHLAEKILTSKSALEGERKHVTVLFADLKGSMELLADRDPEEARRLLDPVLERMMEAAHHYEGTVNQVIGDGIMALFGAPVLDPPASGASNGRVRDGPWSERRDPEPMGGLSGWTTSTRSPDIPHQRESLMSGLPRDGRATRDQDTAAPVRRVAPPEAMTEWELHGARRSIPRRARATDVSLKASRTSPGRRELGVQLGFVDREDEQMISRRE
jgi:class 3 adenylate cyclase